MLLLTHLALMRNVGLCREKSALHMGNDASGIPFYNSDDDRIVFGLWRECMKQREKINCEMCKLYILVIEANGLEWMFDKDSRMLCEKLRELLKRD